MPLHQLSGGEALIKFNAFFSRPMDVVKINEICEQPFVNNILI